MVMPQWRRTLRFTGSVSAAAAATVLCLNFIIAARSFGQTSHIAADPELQEVYYMYEDSCGCRRFNISDSVAAIGAESLCSSYSTSRGPGQKVISFSLYGNAAAANGTFYNGGIEKNLEAMREHYPSGFLVRIYHDFDFGDGERLDVLCRISCRNADIDLCDARDIVGKYGNVADSFGMLWRFAPMSDPFVDEFHSRDLDSVISAREAAAVKDFREETVRTLHVMRDNPQHGTIVLGGMFGARMPSLGEEDPRKVRPRMSKVFDKMLKKGTSRVKSKGLDQMLLAQYLWPEFSSDAVHHDAYKCKAFGRRGGVMRPFPTQRLSGKNFTHVPDNFVGSNGGSVGADKQRSHICPVDCRPEGHKDWMLC